MFACSVFLRNVLPSFLILAINHFIIKSIIVVTHIKNNVPPPQKKAPKNQKTDLLIQLLKNIFIQQYKYAQS